MGSAIIPHTLSLMGRMPDIVVLRAAAVYFIGVFGIGFMLGPIRVLWLQPRVGERLAELIEAPLMLSAIVLVARWLLQRFAGRIGEAGWLAVGAAAAATVLVADFAVGVGLRGLSPAAVVFDRDPLAGTVYYLLLLLFAAMPRLLCRRYAAVADSEDFRSQLESALAELTAAGWAEAAAACRKRCLECAFTTSTEWLGEAGAAVDDLLQVVGPRMPAATRSRLLAVLSRIGRVWPKYRWLSLRRRLFGW